MFIRTFEYLLTDCSVIFGGLKILPQVNPIHVNFPKRSLKIDINYLIWTQFESSKWKKTEDTKNNRFN